MLRSVSIISQISQALKLPGNIYIYIVSLFVQMYTKLCRYPRSAIYMFVRVPESVTAYSLVFLAKEVHAESATCRTYAATPISEFPPRKAV